MYDRFLLFNYKRIRFGSRVIKIVRELFEQIANWQEPIPGAKMEEWQLLIYGFRKS